MENSLQRSYITMDKDGDGHYDVLSALQKSIRGSDVNASLHYAARLVEAGDLPSLARRLTVIAYEDIGLANPDPPCASSHGYSFGSCTESRFPRGAYFDC